MESAVVCIGHEILVGHTVNTNAAAIARDLLSIGVRVKRIITIEDEPSEIIEVVGALMDEVQVVITTGGLGPTKDDLTKSAVSKIFGIPQILDKELASDIKARYLNLGYKRVPKGGMNQALVLRGAAIFRNPVGSAPCLLLQKKGAMLFLLPGVPEEMKTLMKVAVLPYLREHISGPVIKVRTLGTSGIGETGLAEIIEPVIGRVRNPSISYLPGLEGVNVMLTGKAKSLSAVEKKLQNIQDKILPLIRRWVFTIEEENLTTVVARILTEQNVTISVAESCTGGYLASRLTDISGSSAYFERGVVTYSNEAKEQLLNVPRRMLEKYGAVSPQVAKAMAENIRKISGTDLALSTTGILGPTGATFEKPVGLVYIGYSDRKKTISTKLNLHYDRAKNKIQTVQKALMILQQQFSKGKK